jgi:hypothetical protein
MDVELRHGDPGSRQTAQHGHEGRLEPYLLPRLAQRGRLGRLTGLHATARERDLAGVLAQPGRPLDEHDLGISRRRQQDQDGRLPARTDLLRTEPPRPERLGQDEVLLQPVGKRPQRLRDRGSVSLRCGLVDRHTVTLRYCRVSCCICSTEPKAPT